ncbi:hypothetical protein PIB30_014460 [Stylosanthes scabra]|uniref:Uncharacterized protein n=1 Tax=Stylosanthes scabra TaxID=79078 RepID=A0ABU6W4S8_9FABA|nr:hypothetical protein [Stylosanthes scabra]
MEIVENKRKCMAASAIGGVAGPIPWQSARVRLLPFSCGFFLILLHVFTISGAVFGCATVSGDANRWYSSHMVGTMVSSRPPCHCCERVNACPSSIEAGSSSFVNCWQTFSILISDYILIRWPPRPLHGCRPSSWC